MARRKKQNEDQPRENPENADDTFGLPEIEYEPLKRDTPEEEKKSEDIPVVQQEPAPYKAEAVRKKKLLTGPKFWEY
jgi:hypothetical protein